MAKKIYSLGNPTITIGSEELKANIDERLVITTKHGQKFEIVIGKNNLEIRTITDMSTGIIVIPGANNFIRIEEQE